MGDAGLQTPYSTITRISDLVSNNRPKAILYSHMQTFVIFIYRPLESGGKTLHQHDWSYQATFLALDVLKSNDQEVPAKMV